MKYFEGMYGVLVLEIYISERLRVSWFFADGRIWKTNDVGGLDDDDVTDTGGYGRYVSRGGVPRYFLL